MDTILHQVKWDQLDQFKEKDFCTDAHHQIQVMKETIPIIFVPGIMGSRLANKQKKIVWDPSYPKSFMVPTYSNITPADRKRLLIEDPSVDVLRWGDNPGADKSFCGDLVNTLSGVGAWDWLPPEIRPSLKDIFTYQLPGTYRSLIRVPQASLPRPGFTASPATPS